MEITQRPDYGIDAPGVIRNLLIAAAAGFILWGSAALGLWSGTLRGSLGSLRIFVPLGWMAIWPAATCALMAGWMLWDSRIGKIRDRERLLDLVRWTGSERVLDVGCGRGLM